MVSLEYHDKGSADWKPVFGDYPTLEQAERAVRNLNAMPKVAYDKYRVAVTK